MNLDQPLDRRRMIAGTLGVALTATAGIGLAGAQEDTATPEATDSATPAASAGGLQTDDDTDETADDRERATEAIAQATVAIDSAQADRDAVASQIDTSTVDAVLGQASAVRDRAQAAADAGPAGEARQLARIATATAKAAGDLIAVQLIAAGLPSQEAPASRTLAEAHESILTATEETADAADADAAFYVTTAQSLYQTAFDLYGGGAYGRAAGTANVAARLAWLGSALATPVDEDGGRRGGQQGGFFGHGRGPGGDRLGAAGDPGDPVPVPEPGF